MELLAIVTSPLTAYAVVAGVVAAGGLFRSVASDAMVIAVVCVAGAFSATAHLSLLWLVLAVVVGWLGGDRIAGRRHRSSQPSRTVADR